MRIIFAVTALLVTAAFGLPAAATETIRTFAANIVLLADGSVDVTETITVKAEGTKIRRGIFRDIPTVLRNDDGSLVRSNFDIVSITRDGRTEPWHTGSIANGVRIYLGDADVFLTPGVYTYTIRYTMTRMARYFEDHDELYWNATGNFWDFAILDAVARVTVPDGAVITDHLAFTGRHGENGGDYRATREEQNVSVFRATRLLEAGEGMTIVVPFQKGILTEPSGLTKALYWLSDHRGLIIPAIAVFLVLLYNLFAWDAVGRDPKKGTIIPLFHAPEGFSPALVHHIHRMGWKKNGWTAFTAALINLGVKNLITIEKVSKKKTILTATSTPAADLPPGEQLIYDYLNSKGTVTIDKKSGPKLNTKRAGFVKKIGSENRHAYFRNNLLYILFGVLLSVICLAAMVVTGVLSPVFAIGAIGGGIAIGLFTTAFGGMWGGGGFGRVAIFAWLGIIGTNVLGSLASAFTSFAVNTALIAAVSIVIINVVFAILMRAPTVQGRKVMDRIEGFRMYLDTAEKERLNLTGAPDMTVRRFESILPYAVALGVEKPWSKHFEGELARNAVAGARHGYHPAWYSGANFSPGNIASDVAAIGTGMSAAMIAAQPSSSSSSGGGGGGFSGGGGGGGGGGGW